MTQLHLGDALSQATPQDVYEYVAAQGDSGATLFEIGARFTISDGYARELLLAGPGRVVATDERRADVYGRPYVVWVARS